MDKVLVFVFVLGAGANQSVIPYSPHFFISPVSRFFSPFPLALTFFPRSSIGPVFLVVRRCVISLRAAKKERIDPLLFFPSYSRFDLVKAALPQ